MSSRTASANAQLNFKDICRRVASDDELLEEVIRVFQEEDVRASIVTLRLQHFWDLYAGALRRYIDQTTGQCIAAEDLDGVFEALTRASNTEPPLPWILGRGREIVDRIRSNLSVRDEQQLKSFLRACKSTERALNAALEGSDEHIAVWLVEALAQLRDRLERAALLRPKVQPFSQEEQVELAVGGLFRAWEEQLLPERPSGERGELIADERISIAA